MVDSINKAKWENCIEYCKDKLSEQQFTTWIKPVSFHSFNTEAHELKVGVPSYFYYEYIEEHYAHLLHEAIGIEFGKGIKLLYTILMDKTNRQRTEVLGNSPIVEEQPANDTQQGAPVQRRTPEIDSNLNREYNFENFIEGESNLLPRSVGMSIAQNPKQKTFNPLFIHGHSGVGKTHLVNAIGMKLKENFPELRVLYLSAHLFHVQFVDANLKNKTNDFIRFYQQIDVLILDDVQEFIGMPKTQNTFFHIFNHLKQNGKQIILTCDRSPIDLQGMEERLMTRFKWGLVAELRQPNEQLRHDILENKIHRNGLKIPKSVIDFISENVTESVRELEGVVTSLMAYSVVYNRNVDLSMARMIVSNATRLERRPITVEEIIAHVCSHCNAKKEDIFTKSRKASIVEVRQIAMYLAHKHTKLPISKIGILVGNRNHATVLHSVKTVEEQMANNNAYKQKVEEIEKDIKMHKPIEKK